MLYYRKNLVSWIQLAAWDELYDVRCYQSSLLICSTVWVALIMKVLFSLVDAYSPNPLWPYGVLPLLQPRQRFPQSCPFPSAQRLPLEKTVRLPVPLSIISGAWLTDGEIIRSSDSSRHLNHCQPQARPGQTIYLLGNEDSRQIFRWHSICEQWKVWIPPCFHYFLSTHPPSFPPFALAIPETLLRQKVRRSTKIYPNNVEHPHRV